MRPQRTFARHTLAGVLAALVITAVDAAQMQREGTVSEPGPAASCSAAALADCPPLPVPAAGNASLFPAPPQVASDTDADNGTLPAYAVICTVIKNQNYDIREWVYYHHWLGFKKIYIYDHNSTRPLLLDLKDWIAAGVVGYTFFDYHHVHQDYRQSPQGRGYKECADLSKAAGHQWAAFIDGDEFFVLNKGANTADIRVFLKQYEAYGGLVVNWKTFGSSGHIAHPNRPVLPTYTNCMPRKDGGENIHIKTIANLPHTRKAAPHPHAPVSYLPGYPAVDEDFRPCPKPFNIPALDSKIALHHYAIKSYANFQQKLRRGRGDKAMSRSADFFYQVNNAATAECLEGLRVFEQCCLAAAGGR